ncbi:MAG TPA: hypothetical protein VN039_08035, partial [Nitrospira sp.]|nr:hypothetical protein [Nitrospira sp.]
MAIIESCQVHRARVAAQGSFAAQIKVNVEVTHRQLAQGAVNRFAITATREIGFCHRAPVAAHFEDRNDMIGVLFCFQIKDQWWEPDYAQRGRSENSTIETGRDPVTQNFF